MVGLGEDPAFDGLQEVVMVAEKCQVAGKSANAPLAGRNEYGLA
jgi:hypothetical protein